MVGLRRSLISVDLEVDIQTSQCYVIFVMIGETLRTLFNDNRIRVNDDYISKIIAPERELLMFPTTGLSIDTVTSKVFQEIMYFQYESFAKSNVGIVYWQSSRFSSNWKTSFANKKRHSKRYDVAIQ